MTGLEPVTSSLPRTRSTTELHRQKKRAGDGAQTRDPQLGRLMLYQLSYSRLSFFSVIKSGERRIRTSEGVRQQIYSLPHLTALVSPQKLSRWRDSNPRPADYKSAALAN
jgi:hypothetical protein